MPFGFYFAKVIIWVEWEILYISKGSILVSFKYIISIKTVFFLPVGSTHLSSLKFLNCLLLTQLSFHKFPHCCIFYWTKFWQCWAELSSSHPISVIKLVLISVLSRGDCSLTLLGVDYCRNGHLGCQLCYSSFYWCCLISV